MFSLKTIISYYWPHIIKYKKSFFSTFVFYGASMVIAGSITPLYYKKIIDVISLGGAIQNKETLLMSLFVKLALFILAYNIFFRTADFFMVFCQTRILRDLRNYAFDKTTEHSYVFFSNNFSGSLVAKIKRFVGSFETIHDTTVFAFWMVAVKLLSIIVVLFWTIPILGLVFSVWCVAYIAMTMFFVKKKIKYDFKESEEDSRVTARFSDVISNILNIKLFTSKKNEYESFMEISERERLAQSKAWRLGNIIFASQGFLLMTLEMAGMYFAIRLWLDGSISAGSVVLVQIYMGGIFASIWELGRAVARFYKALSSASEMVEIFEKKLDVADLPNPESCAIKNGEIVFENMVFGYNKNNFVFESFNLKILAGEKVGLVGRSGSGKSTLTKLLLRFVDVKDGFIKIDGQNISNLRQSDLRKNIAYIPQDTILFHRSLRENIAYGNDQATEEEIVEASKKAHAHEFISSFSDGYDTLVGERGVKLSGGERQRVAIARAMLKKAPILILDEATSSLDTISEKYIQDSFEQLMSGRTTIVIAHRLSTVQKMDRIIVLDKGKIAEEGTHKDLLEKNGIYGELWKHQTNGFLE